MLVKIKLLAQKALEYAKKLWASLKQNIHSEKTGALPQKLRVFWEKLWQSVINLWRNSENRILLILIGAVLALLILAVILFFCIDWTNTVGICYRADTDASNAAYRQLLEQSLAKQGFEVIVNDADGDREKQLKQIADMADRRCDAIVVEPVLGISGEALTAALTDAGLPSVLIGSQIEGTEQALLWVGSDIAQAGALQGQMAASLPHCGDINGDGTVSYLLIQGTETDPDSALLEAGFVNTLAENNVQAQRLTAVCGEWTKAGGQESCTQALAEYGKDIEVILCTNDPMAFGAVAAIADGGRQVGQDVYLYSVGGQAEALRLIQAGDISGTVHTDPAQQVSAVIEGLLARIGGQTPRTQYQPPYEAVTAENVAQYLTEE